MKKLLKSTAAFLFLFSLLLVSCEKEAPVNPNPQGGLVFAIDYKWTPTTAGEKEKKGTGNVAGAEKGVLIQFTPRILAGSCCKGGKWGFNVTPNPGVALYQDPNTGRVDFVAHYAGSYEVRIWYTCPEGDTYSETITVEIK